MLGLWTSATANVPKPDTIVPYVAYGDEPNGALYVFGDPSSPKMALLCAGFPDDQTVFLPFAKALSEQHRGGTCSSSSSGGGSGGVLVGVMCLPGYDDRPEEGIPWESHPPGGFSFDQCERAVREASRALRKVSTHEHPEFTGIFHDWGVTPGTLWAHRVEAEARDGGAASDDFPRPHRMVFFDVLLEPSHTMPGVIPTSDCKVPGPTPLQMIIYAYMGVNAVAFWISRYLSKHLAVAFASFFSALLFVTGLSPVYAFDFESRSKLYGKNQQTGPQRMVYMSYMYSRLLTGMWRSERFSYLPGQLHEDWKATPILYLHGTNKRQTYHFNVSLEMLQREEKEKRSLSKAVAVEGAGHWLYVQKQDECLKHVLDFMNAENTFVS